MKKISNILAISVLSLMVLALPTAASAQWGNQRPNYGNQGRDLRYVARNLKERSRQFEHRVDDIVDSSRDRRGGYGGYGGYGGRDTGYYNDDLKQLAGDFRRAADRFEDKYGNGRNLRNSEDAARRLLDAASRMDNALRNSRMNRMLMSQWSSMQRDVNLIANTYGYNYNRGNRRNPNDRRSPNRNGDWRNRIPFPLPF